MATGQIQNFIVQDVFAEESNVLERKIHLYMKRRNARKTTTSIINLPDEVDLKRVNKALKRLLHCDGSVKKAKDENDDVRYILLSGDQRNSVADFLVDQNICERHQIVIHGG